MEHLPVTSRHYEDNQEAESEVNDFSGKILISLDL